MPNPLGKKAWHVELGGQNSFDPAQGQGERSTHHVRVRTYACVRIDLLTLLPPYGRVYRSYSLNNEEVSGKVAEKT